MPRKWQWKDMNKNQKSKSKNQKSAGKRVLIVRLDRIGAIGHSLGASGGIELVATCKTIQTSIIHPTINLDSIDPECDPKLDFVPKVAKQRKVNYAASNSFGFGGHNCCLVVGKV